MRLLALQKKSNEPKDLLPPTPELPDDTPINRVQLPSRILKALLAEGIKTLGGLRETADDTLLSFQDLGKGSVAHLREKLGPSSIVGVGPTGKKPA
jgi:DNA-directed RNA polymerase alpha subunit